MEIKFKEKLFNYKYLIMFDLASKITGICVFDLQTQKPLYTEVIKVKGTLELPAIELKEGINNFFLNLQNRGINLDTILVAKERMPTQIHGGASTVQTFIALARSHAILDTYLFEHQIATYDYIGVAPITTHAYLRKLLNLSTKQKITKDLIKDYVCQLYSLNEAITLDETDAVFLAKTFIDIKWNNDVKEEIRQCKRHYKELKVASAKIKVQNEIERLQNLLI